MDAEDFYEKFKEALEFLELNCRSMKLAQIRIVDDQIVISCQGLSAGIKIPQG